MRKLTESDLTKVIGSTIEGYHVEAAKIKQGPLADSDHYGFLLGKNVRGEYVTWQFHLLDDDSVYTYWGISFKAERKPCGISLPGAWMRYQNGLMRPSPRHWS